MSFLRALLSSSALKKPHPFSQQIDTCRDNKERLSNDEFMLCIVTNAALRNRENFVLCFANIVLFFGKIVWCFANILLCFDNIVLCFNNPCCVSVNLCCV